MNKSFYSILLSFALVACSPVSEYKFPVVDNFTPHVWSDDPAEEIRETPEKAYGIYSMYDFDSPRVVERAPKGYTPCYISHYGRHGARYIGSKSNYSSINSALTKAHEDGRLTEKGEEIYSIFTKHYDTWISHTGVLTQKGGIQHELLAKRMYANYPEVFAGKGTVKASSTHVPRCIVSMGRFLSALTSINPDLTLYTEVSDSMQVILNPYETKPFNPIITDEDLAHFNKVSNDLPEVKALRKKYAKDIDIFERIFTDSEYAANLVGSKSSFLLNLYNIERNIGCLDCEDIAPIEILTVEEKILMANYFSAGFYYKRGNTPEWGDRLRALSGLLINDIIENADKDMASGACCARLRFGHDSILCALLPAMEIDGWANTHTEGDNYLDEARIWDIPMASNLQIVFYKGACESDPILVRVMLNEYSKVLPLEDQSLAPYYKWEDFKTYYSVE